MLIWLSISSPVAVSREAPTAGASASSDSSSSQGEAVEDVTSGTFKPFSSYQELVNASQLQGSK